MRWASASSEAEVRVVQDQACLGFIGDLRVALTLQRSHDLLRVMGVHLTAEGLDVEGLHKGNTSTL